MAYIDDIAQKYNALPMEVRTKLQTQDVRQEIFGLERRYAVKLNFLLMLVLTGELAIEDIPEYMQKRFQLTDEDSIAFKKALIARVLKAFLEPEDLKQLTPTNEMKDILQGKLVQIFEGTEEAKAEFNEKMAYALVADDDAEPDELAKLLYANQERLTQKRLTLEDRPQEPTIANWLKDFILFAGAMTFDNVTLTRYMTTSANVQVLDPGERERVAKLMKLYRAVKFYPASMPNDPNEWEFIAEEQQEELTKTRPGAVFTPYFPSAERIPSLGERFRAHEKKFETILKKEDELLASTQGDVERIKRELANAARSGDEVTLSACMQLLARAGMLMTILKQQPAWLDATLASVRRKYESTIGKVALDQLIENAKINPVSLPLLSEFLQYLLKERGKMSESESALVGVHIGQTVQGEKQTLAFGNEATGEFEWVKNRVEGGTLVSELTQNPS